MTDTATPIGFSIGQIVERVGKPIHRVRYVIDARRIEPAGRIGNARVFSIHDVERIESELRRIESDR